MEKWKHLENGVIQDIAIKYLGSKNLASDFLNGIFRENHLPNTKPKPGSAAK